MLQEKTEVIRRMEGGKSCPTISMNLYMAPFTVNGIMERRQTILHSYFKEKSEEPSTDPKMAENDPVKHDNPQP
jgi:hypothetical protein